MIGVSAFYDLGCDATLAAGGVAGFARAGNAGGATLATAREAAAVAQPDPGCAGAGLDCPGQGFLEFLAKINWKVPPALLARAGFSVKCIGLRRVIVDDLALWKLSCYGSIDVLASRLMMKMNGVSSHGFCSSSKVPYSVQLIGVNHHQGRRHLQRLRAEKGCRRARVTPYRPCIVCQPHGCVHQQIRAEQQNHQGGHRQRAEAPPTGDISARYRQDGPANRPGRQSPALRATSG